ncbi:uroporphyrinogen decarboxylase family protein [Desulfobacterium sp. N47]|uniref:Uroporphyrinogen decarboxylase (URO-D) domain-containing protein n=1 Tax=uncultured Desulfobacterium sp. TaxID=201089 RepID=E1YMJ1_9BACT|nr:hypothetical protein N47_N26100 [uncultured Desulfobacterium sp.]
MEQNLSYNSRQRVQKTIRHEATDRIPKGELTIADAVIKRELNCTDVGFDEKSRFVNQIGLDIITISPVFKHGKEKLAAPGDSTWPDIEKWCKDTSLFTFAVVNGALETGMRIHEWSGFLKLIKKSPPILSSFIEDVEKLNISMFKEVAQMGVDGILLADDVAYAGGLLVNPKILRQNFFPSLARQAEEIDRLGLFAFYHSDGNYQEIIPDLIDMHFQGIQCLEQRSGMDTAKLQEQYGDRICLWGSIDIEDTVNARKPDNLKTITDSLKSLQKQKGIILGTNNGLYEVTDIAGLTAIYQSLY